jgi:chorismate synthase
MAFRKLRLLTAGESHGPGVMAILEGFPSAVPISKSVLQSEMKRRKAGYGRGGRMKIETDEVEIFGGIRAGKTIGSPIGLLVKNMDYANWTDVMPVWEVLLEGRKKVSRPRPGHADLAGGLKFGEHDLRNILERASARETVVRGAAGFLCKQLLQQIGILIGSHVVSIGPICSSDLNPSWGKISAVQQSEELRCVDPETEKKMMAAIGEAKEKKETLGGTFQVVAVNVPPGLGSHTHWDAKIDGRIAQAILSIPSVKGVSIGDAFRIASEFGSKAHDEIFYDQKKGFYRKTNFAGGTEGGITNGQELRIYAAMKPLSTLMKPLQSVDVESKVPQEAVVERSDVCSVPAGAVVAEAMLALVLADAVLEKFSCDTLPDLLDAVQYYRKRLQDY